LTGNLVSISPFFIVKDLQASIAFYREHVWCDGLQADGYVIAFFRLRNE
jgi:hypothetical protein